MFKIY